MKKALIVTNISREQPGTILSVAEERGWATDIINLDQGDQFPSPERYDALIVMGGPSSANDSAEETSWMSDEIQKIHTALAAKIPYLGVCLGMQVLVKAAGGKVIPSPIKEVGFRESYTEPLGKFYTMHPTEEGATDSLLTDITGDIPIFHLHGETVELSPEMSLPAVLIGTAEGVSHQIVRVGRNAYGLQGHFELTTEMLNTWLKEDPDLLALGEAGIEQVRKDFEGLKKEYTGTAKKIYTNFLQLAE